MNENLQLPGNPRYQPAELRPYFGYDNLYRPIGQVEIASLEVMGEIGFMPNHLALALTAQLKDRILAVSTTDIYAMENKTKHDIRAWVAEVSKHVGPDIANWLHLMLTSYDPIDTGRIVMFTRAHQNVVAPKARRVLEILIDMVVEFADQIQIGRTHGQHALPITVGFWLATLLYRIYYNLEKMDDHCSELVGKISGAVGAYNAQLGLGLHEKCGDESFEERVLWKLGLQPSPISTQILPPEPLAYYLFSAVMESGSLAQLARDCRQLMRSEIAEVQEEFSSEQSGSSTMAHKRNPINFENIEGTFLKTKNEFGKVMDTLISEHQRDLVGSCVARDFPTIIVNLVLQYNTLLRTNDKGVPFLRRVTINKEACEKNFSQNSNVILSEPAYIALQIAGLTDAHGFVNHEVVPLAKERGEDLVSVISEICARGDSDVRKAWYKIPEEVRNLLRRPEKYKGLAKEKALEIADMVGGYIK